MTTFVLIHGGAHGAWCWDEVIPELTSRGFGCLAPELPLDDPSAGLSICADVVAAAAEQTDDDLVVVAHSASGAFLPLAAARARARRMIFLCAVVPEEGRSWIEQVMADPAIIPDAPAGVTFDDHGRAVFSEEAARDYFFNDTTDEVAARATKRLVPFAQTIPTEEFPRGAWPDAPAAYVLGTLDRAISPDWSRRVAHERLGTTPVELPTGHDPFLTRPERLAEAFVHAATAAQ